MGQESEDYQLAKKCFLEHRGNHFFMERDDSIELYKRYKIDRDTEKKWAREQVMPLLQEFKKNKVHDDTFVKLKSFIESGEDIDGLKTFLRIIRNDLKLLDTFTLVIFAEEIFRIMRDSKYSTVLSSRELIEEEFALIRDLLGCASTKEFHIAPCYLMNPYIQECSLTEERIRERIRWSVQRLESYQFPWDYKGRFWRWLQSKIPWAKKL